MDAWQILKEKSEGSGDAWTLLNNIREGETEIEIVENITYIPIINSIETSESEPLILEIASTSNSDELIIDVREDEVDVNNKDKGLEVKNNELKIS